MTDKIRIRVAALVTALFLAGLSIAGVALHSGPHATTSQSPTAVSVSGQPPAPTPAVLHEDEEEGDHD